MEAQRIPMLVAHRGYSAAYPENTLLAIEKAFQCGACFIEFDVQISRDGIPVVIHDVALLRTTGVQGNVHALSGAEITATVAGEPARFGDRFSNEKIPSLQAVVDLLMQWPSRQAFVEIKRASINHFGVTEVMQCIGAIVASVSHQIIIISFDARVLQQARAMGLAQIGWVFDQWNPHVFDTLRSLEPDYAFADTTCVSDTALVLECIAAGSGKNGAGNHGVDNELSVDDAFPVVQNMQWAVYTVDDAQAALEWGDRGVALVETNAIGDLLQHPLLKKRCCYD